MRPPPRPEILLHPNIPKPMHGLAPRVVLGQKWWDAQRRIAYAKTEYCCAACGVYTAEAKYFPWLEAHELYNINYDTGKMTFLEVVALCHSCHNYIHDGRMQILVLKCEMLSTKRKAILRHGKKILKAAGLRKPRPPIECANWNKWRLVLYGREYKGKFENYEAWVDYYDNKENT